MSVVVTPYFLAECTLCAWQGIVLWKTAEDAERDWIAHHNQAHVTRKAADDAQPPGRPSAGPRTLRPLGLGAPSRTEKGEAKPPTTYVEEVSSGIPEDATSVCRHCGMAIQWENRPYVYGRWVHRDTRLIVCLPRPHERAEPPARRIER